MNSLALLQRIRESVQQGSYRLSVHAERERDADQVTNAEIRETFGAGHIELLEDYPDDPRGHSVLVLGFSNAGVPIHAAIGLSRTQVVFITIYRPDPESWYDWRRRV